MTARNTTWWRGLGTRIQTQETVYEPARVAYGTHTLFVKAEAGGSAGFRNA